LRKPIAAMPSPPRSRVSGSNQKDIVINALRTDPALAEAFMARLARQLQELRARMELRNIRSARDRVLQYLRLRAGIGGRSIALDGELQNIAAETGVPVRCSIGHWQPSKPRDI